MVTIVQCGIDYEDLEAFKNSEQGYFKRFKQDEDIPFPADAEILNQGKFLPISLCYLTAAQGKEKTIPLNLKIEFPVLRK